LDLYLYQIFNYFTFIQNDYFNLLNYLIIIFYFLSKKGYGDWGLGIGDWGLGIGPNPQSPIPNPH